MSRGNAFEFQEVIAHPREKVYDILRNRMPELIPLLPNVDTLTIVERGEVAPGRLKQVNAWQGKPTSAPKIVQPFITQEMTRWTDYADWEDAHYRVNWRFAMPGMDSFFSCEGTNYFEDAGGKTRLRLTGVLTLYPEKVPGVPKLLAKTVAPPLEKWVLGMVKPNLTELPAAVARFLDQTAAK